MNNPEQQPPADEVAESDNLEPQCDKNNESIYVQEKGLPKTTDDIIDDTQDMIHTTQGMIQDSKAHLEGM